MDRKICMSEGMLKGVCEGVFVGVSTECIDRVVLD